MPKASFKRKFASAMAHHRAGRLHEAESLCRKILLRDPNRTDAMHLLALVATETNRHDAAILLLTRAIEIHGPLPAYCSTLGIVLARRGNPQDAVACFQLALRSNPNDANTHLNLGRVLLALERTGEAEESYRRAIELNPGSAESQFELGNLLAASNHHDEAAECYTKALKAKSDVAQAHYNLGVMRMIQGRLTEALEAYQAAVRIQPNYPDANNNLGIVLRLIHGNQAAADQFRTALQYSNHSADAWYNLAVQLQEQGRLQEARDTYLELLSRYPSHGEAHNNLGNVQADLGLTVQALRSYRRALAINPQDPEAHWNLSLALLRSGQLDEGWREYEWRFKKAGTVVPSFSKPRWDGSSPAGRRMLLHAEQGLGDTLQFIRFASMLKQRGAQVILECHEPLVRLLARTEGLDAVVAKDHALPPFDLHAPLLSIPGMIGTSLDSIPRTVPYIQVQSSLVELWKSKISDSIPSGNLKVGLAWSGSLSHKDNPRRSLPAVELAGLAGISGLSLFSLQKGEPNITHAPELEALDLIRLENETTSLLDTAAIVLNLDLLISVDTSIAHLGGALGRPVWTLLAHPADWRWLEDREDSPWYPTMRLFRQSARGDWASVIDRVRQELQSLAGSR